MPKVIGIESTYGELVKEDEAGLTFDELQEFYGPKSETMKKFRFALTLERQLDKARSVGFDDWALKAIKLELFKSVKQNHTSLVVGRDNHKDANWLFLITKKRWILIDP